MGYSNFRIDLHPPSWCVGKLLSICWNKFTDVETRTLRTAAGDLRFLTLLNLFYNISIESISIQFSPTRAIVPNCGFLVGGSVGKPPTVCDMRCHSIVACCGKQKDPYIGQWMGQRKRCWKLWGWLWRGKSQVKFLSNSKLRTERGEDILRTNWHWEKCTHQRTLESWA